MKVAVIGAGAGGLTAIKTCLEEGLSPVCFEQKDGLGGLWRYLEKPIVGQPSVMYSTVSNTDKETFCFSDFPVPEGFSNYLHHTKILEYLALYAKHFDLEKYIRYYTEVVEVRQSEDFQTTGKWIVVTKDTVSGVVATEAFDGVFVCNGHYSQPYQPHFNGTAKFRGKQMHAHEYRHPNDFQNKRVVVVGLSNTAGDIAAELTHVSSQVYMSCRRNMWIVPRFLKGGFTLLNVTSTRFYNSLPLSIQNSVLKGLLNGNVDHSLYGMAPEQEPIDQLVVVNDFLLSLFAVGRIVLRPNIKRIKETGVVFDDGTEEDNIDAIIYATGYRIQFPFLKHPSYVVQEGNVVNLYKFVFAPDVKPNTLAIIGVFNPTGPYFPILELQVRWAVAVFKGENSLPSEEKMRREIRNRRREIVGRCAACPTYSTYVEWIVYMDEIASEIGCKPSCARLFLTDPRLALSVYFGQCIPSHYRLVGKRTWPGARSAILNSWERMTKSFKSIGPGIYAKKENRSSGSSFPKLFFLVSGISILVYFLLYAI